MCAVGAPGPLCVLLAETISRVAADQSVVAPAFMSTFLYYNDVLAGHGHDYAVRDIQEVCTAYERATGSEHRADPRRSSHPFDRYRNSGQR